MNEYEYLEWFIEERRLIETIMLVDPLLKQKSEMVERQGENLDWDEDVNYSEEF